MDRSIDIRNDDDAYDDDDDAGSIRGIDVVAIVHGLDRPLPPGRLERMLVLAEDSGAETLVVLTKADAAGPDDDTAEVVAAVAGQVPVLVTSIEDGSGFDLLRERIGSGRTLALIGASGSGKSTIVNTLVGHELLDVGEVRERDAKGRHTTTARELVLLPGDAGLILDTPGIRAIGLWDAEEALHRVFDDLDDLATECRFNDCRHDREPGCALVEGVESGAVDRHRFDRERSEHQRRFVAGRSAHLRREAVRGWGRVPARPRRGPRRARNARAPSSGRPAGRGDS